MGEAVGRKEGLGWQGGDVGLGEAWLTVKSVAGELAQEAGAAPSRTHAGAGTLVRMLADTSCRETADA